MGNFKVLDTVPDVGNIKVGETNVKRIYKGNSWVWPPLDDSYIPDEEISVYEGSSNSDFGYIANVSPVQPNIIGAENTIFDDNGFALFDSSGAKINPVHPFGPLPAHAPKIYRAQYRGHNFGHYTETHSQIVGASDDYKYMIAAGRNKYNANFWQYPQATPRDMTDPSNFYGTSGGNYTIDTIVMTKDYGQTWNEFPYPYIDNPHGVFEGYRDIEMSNNGQVIIISYYVSLRDPSSRQYREGPFFYESGTRKLVRYGFQAYSKFLISRDFGETFTELNINLSLPGFKRGTALRGHEYSGRDQTTNYFTSSKGFQTISKIRMSSTGKSIIIPVQRNSRFISSRGNTHDIYLSTDFGYNWVSLGERTQQGQTRNLDAVDSMGLQNHYPLGYNFEGHALISGNGKVIFLRGIPIRLGSKNSDQISIDYGETFQTYRGPYDTRRVGGGPLNIDYTGNIITYQQYAEAGQYHVYNWLDASYFEGAPSNTELQRKMNSEQYQIMNSVHTRGAWFFNRGLGWCMSPRGMFVVGWRGRRNSVDNRNLFVETGRFFTNPNYPSVKIATGSPGGHVPGFYWDYVPIKAIKL